MKRRRVLVAAAIAAGFLGSTASTALAKPPKCPPGQTATVEVVGTELVTTCRVL
jgi:hypothetical protein